MNKEALQLYMKNLSDEEREAIVKALNILCWPVIKENSIADLYLATVNSLNELVEEMEAAK